MILREILNGSNTRRVFHPVQDRTLVSFLVTVSERPHGLLKTLEKLHHRFPVQTGPHATDRWSSDDEGRLYSTLLSSSRRPNRNNDSAARIKFHPVHVKQIASALETAVEEMLDTCFRWPLPPPSPIPTSGDPISSRSSSRPMGASRGTGARHRLGLLRSLPCSSLQDTSINPYINQKKAKEFGATFGIQRWTARFQHQALDYQLFWNLSPPSRPLISLLVIPSF